MYLPTLLTSLSLSASTALAAQAKVHNKCDFPVWVTSVQGQAGQTQNIPPGSTFSEEQRNPDRGTGVSIQVTTTEPGPNNPQPILILGYSWSNVTGLYYSLSTVNGFAFKGKKLRIHNTEGKPVEQILWYGEPKPDYTAAYLKGEADITLELCDDFA
ncbi:hypothetical protein COCCADRAFT_22870 [Bipolaris zeicola 26-R-13]|uniref:Bys1 family protein n=1 Tax=Cochliobolus carbonum (strain 26-R-13) TaxID=930089 RepID=W6YIU8_COCC2|nr:uncharacterized protein COCCADRAFT_22870 [Bipolaris zeicola 26-R-13]EUC37495.1 hypothetical protein COCCADRAFT_22870 [Bipolaris zeicola 26-R-13]